MKNNILLFCFCLLLCSCEETAVADNNTNTQSVTNNQARASNDTGGDAPSANSDKTDQQIESMGKEMTFADFNEQIKKAKMDKEGWTDSPLSVMLKFTGADVDSNVKSVRSKKLGPGENIQDVMVTVEEDGLMDDSVRGTITMVRMKKTDGLWQVYKATQAWKCWKGRGHETYSSEPCK